MAADPLRSEESFNQTNATHEAPNQNLGPAASFSNPFTTASLTQIFERAKLVLTNPVAAWEKIKSEPTTIEQLYKNYIIVLAAIPAVCQWISGPLFGQASLIGGTIFTLVQFALNMGVLYAYSLIIEALSPKFDGAANRVDGLKLLAYSATPGWLGGVFGLIHALSPLTLLCAMYGLYIYYKGIPALRVSTEEKAMSFMFTSIGAFLLVGISIVMLGFLFGFGLFGAVA